MLPALVGAVLRRCPRAAVIAVLALTVTMPAAPAQDGAPIGELGRALGEVSVVRGAQRQPAQSGTVLYQGDAVVTGPGSRAEIRCGDGSTITLGADTTLSLAEFAPSQAGTGRGFLDLVQGILRIALSSGRPWQSFEVRSATAVASVRSTEWIVDATRVTTGVFVIGGSVAVTNRDGAGEVLLTAGQGTDVPAAGVPSAAKTWGQKRVDDVLARTQLP